MPTYKKAYSDNAFPLNGNKADPACKVDNTKILSKDIDGIMKAYKEALPFIEFSGPTYTAEVLKNA